MKKENVFIDFESYGTKKASYWLNCFDRELIILFYGLDDSDIELIEKSLDESYMNWHDLITDDCCEEYMINKLHPYYKNHIVAVIYDEEDEEDE